MKERLKAIKNSLLSSKVSTDVRMKRNTTEADVSNYPYSLLAGKGCVLDRNDEKKKDFQLAWISDETVVIEANGSESFLLHD